MFFSNISCFRSFLRTRTLTNFLISYLLVIIVIPLNLQEGSILPPVVKKLFPILVHINDTQRVHRYQLRPMKLYTDVMGILRLSER